MKKNVESGGINYYTFKKCLNVMKMFLFITILSVGQLIAVESYSQKTKLSLNSNQSDLIRILDEIENQSSFYFLFNEKLIDLDRKVSIQVTDQTIDTVLETLFSDSDVKYQIVDRKIVLTPGQTSLLQQEISITGIVTSENNEPLPGVSIVVKGTSRGTITDINGSFTLNNVSDNATLAFSFIGMKMQELSVNGRSVINVVLVEDAIGLEEVVAIGYGSVKKSDLTGSVASISTEDIAKSATNTVIQTLQGRAAGVQVSTGDASPGGGINIRIRGTSTITGSTEPLYIIDGFPVNSDNDDLYVAGGYAEGSVEGHANNKVRPNALSFINPADIESIEILKDAAATAIYGSRGANGVVLIKTKRGKVGANQVSINYSLGMQKLIKKIDRLDGPAWAARRTQAQINGGVSPGSVDYNGSDEYHPLPANAESHDYQDLAYQVAPVHDLSLSFSGGNASSKYLLSGKLYDQEGIMIGSDYKNAQLRVNLDQNVGDRFSISTNLLIDHSIHHKNPAGAGFGFNIVNSILDYSPAVNPEWFDESTGRWYVDTKAAESYLFTNPIKLIEGIHDETKTNRLLANAIAEYKIASSLKFSGSYGIDYSDAVRKTYIDRTLTLSGDPAPNGDARINSVTSTRTNGNAYLTWSESFGDHKLDAVAGAEVVSQTIEKLNVGIREFATDEFLTDNLAAGDAETRSLSNGKNKWQTVGFFGRLNYSYLNKYYASVNVRYDGSSVFGASNKYAFFPSLALAWRPSEENFMNSQSLLSDLKIRASIGQTGNGNLSPYSSVGLWSIGGNGYSYDGQIVNYASLSRITNPNLKWETTTQYNVGFDARLLDNRLGFTFDYYIKDTEDLILPVVIPKSTGFQSSIQNVGALQNKGAEFTVNYVVKDKGDFTWDVSANMSFFDVEATDIGEGTNTDVNTGESYVEVATWPRNGGPRLYVGKPAGQIYGYVIEGVFRDQAQADSWPVDHGSNNHKEGYWIYKDLNGDGKITAADQEALGTGQPDMVFGITNNIKWKNFDLSLFFQGVTGTDVLMRYGGDIDENFTDVWTPENRDARSAINKTGGNGSRDGYKNRDMWDASYLRLNNVRLGYTFPKSKIGSLNGLNVYFNATNVFTITNYPGYNPDVSSGGAFAFGEGFDGGVYPAAKVYTLGVNVNF